MGSSTGPRAAKFPQKNTGPPRASPALYSVVRDSGVGLEVGIALPWAFRAFEYSRMPTNSPIFPTNAWALLLCNSAKFGVLCAGVTVFVSHGVTLLLLGVTGVRWLFFGAP